MGTGNGNRGRTGARRVATAGSADVPPQGQGMEAFENWLNTNGGDLDRTLVDTGAELAFNNNEIETTSRGPNVVGGFDDLPASVQREYIRGALTSGGNAQSIVDPQNRQQFQGIDTDTARLSRTAMEPVARREHFYWQTAYTDAQVRPQGRVARQAVSRLRDIQNQSTDAGVVRRARSVADRISEAYGLEGRPGVVGIKPGATGRGSFDLITSPRLRKYNPDTVES
jgi:hypothetical protein